MNLEARKIEFVKEFLKLQSEEAFSRLEKLLRKERKVSDEQLIEPMTEEELNKRIDQSESDFGNNRFKSSSELLSKFE
jgi:Ser-tRNA(Ala) deacylase AlaX